MKQKNTVILAIVWLLVMVGIAASTVTLLASGRSSENTRWISKSDAEALERYARIEEIRKTLQENYYQEIDDDVLLDGAIRGMLAALKDPYSLYYSEDEMIRHMEEVEGEYKGIGLLVENNADGYIEVLRVYADGPADKAGAMPGDLIVRVDGKAVYGTSKQTLDEAREIMRGADGSMVVLTVRREDETRDLKVVRGDVFISNVSSALLDENIGYINICQFSGDAVEGFKTALEGLREKGMQSLVIDVRNNPGGILDDVVQIADALLPKGTIVYTKDRAGSRTDYYSDAACFDFPIAVLINEMSASASEILASAVQDMDRGTIIGMQSYGKGIVQTLVTFEGDGAGMQYTSACYYTPSGRNIHGTGVTPDVVIENDEGWVYRYETPDVESDAQLCEAIKILQKEMMEGANTSDS